jgi:hypothetical protein
MSINPVIQSKSRLISHAQTTYKWQYFRVSSVIKCVYAGNEWCYKILISTNYNSINAFILFVYLTIVFHRCFRRQTVQFRILDGQERQIRLDRRCHWGTQGWWHDTKSMVSCFRTLSADVAHLMFLCRLYKVIRSSCRYLCNRTKFRVKLPFVSSSVTSYIKMALYFSIHQIIWSYTTQPYIQW